MIRVSTIGDLIDCGYGLNGWCAACGTGRPVDVEALAARYGRGASYIKPRSPIRLRCRDCNSLADYQLANTCAYQPGGR